MPTKTPISRRSRGGVTSLLRRRMRASELLHKFRYRPVQPSEVRRDSRELLALVATLPAPLLFPHNKAETTGILHAYLAEAIMRKEAERTDDEMRMAARHLLHSLRFERGLPVTQKIEMLVQAAFIRASIHSECNDRRSLDVALECYLRARRLEHDAGLPPNESFLILTMMLAESYAAANSECRGTVGAIALQLLETASQEAPLLGHNEMLQHIEILKAQILSDWPEGGRRENFEKALSILKACVDTARNEFGTDYTAVAEALTELGYTYAQSRIGHEADNVELGIGCLEEAAAIAPMDTPPRLRGNIKMYLGDGYRGRMRGDELSNLKVSAQHYEEAAMVFMSANMKDRATRAFASYNALTPRIAALEAKRAPSGQRGAL